MSLLRSCLRIRRLKRTANRLGRMPDVVLRHELDWLALEIAADKMSKQRTLKDGNSEIDPTEGKICGWIVIGHPDTGIHEIVEEGQQRDVQGNKKVNQSEILLSYRTRLVDLPGHSPSTSLKSQSCQVWSNDQVHVRAMAQRLAIALCRTTEALFGAVDGQDSVTLGLRVDVWKWLLDQQSASHTQVGGQPNDTFLERTWHKVSEPDVIEVVIQPPQDLSPTSWSVDSAML